MLKFIGTEKTLPIDWTQKPLKKTLLCNFQGRKDS